MIPPDVELAELGKDIGAAADTALEDINPANPHLFTSDLWRDHFARLRAEDPVHFNEIESAGRYWSIMNYDDVRTIDGDWENFSSAKGMTLGLRPTPREQFDVPTDHAVYLDGPSGAHGTTKDGAIGWGTGQRPQS